MHWEADESWDIFMRLYERIRVSKWQELLVAYDHYNWHRHNNHGNNHNRNYDNQNYSYNNRDT